MPCPYQGLGSYIILLNFILKQHDISEEITLLSSFRHGDACMPSENNQPLRTRSFYTLGALGSFISLGLILFFWHDRPYFTLYSANLTRDFAFMCKQAKSLELAKYAPILTSAELYNCRCMLETAGRSYSEREMKEIIANSYGAWRDRVEPLIEQCLPPDATGSRLLFNFQYGTEE